MIPQVAMVFGDSVDAKFERYHAENPVVYRELRRLALQAKKRGHQKIGIKMIWEVARWNLSIQTNDPDFKLNNNWHARYARLLMAKEPTLAGFFETRTLRS